MRIVVVGAGTVGNQLAAKLSEENHDIIVIDIDYNKLRPLDEYYDLQTITGDATSLAVLQKANVEKADLVISVTNHDATNLVVCKLSERLDIKERAYRIARIRSSGCFDDASIFAPKDSGIDRVIYPEELAADQIRRLIQKPFADQVYQFLNKKVIVMEVTIPENHMLVAKSMSDLPYIKEVDFRIVALTSVRTGESIIPVNWDKTLKAGDKIFIATKKEDAEEVMKVLEFDTKPATKVFIHGGTNIGLSVAKEFEDTDVQINIIEPDREITRQLAYELKSALVLHGDGTDMKLLEGEGVRNAQVFVSVTDDENANLLSCLVAKQMGVSKAVALVTKMDYAPLINQLSIDSVISQRLMTISRIMHFVRQGTVMRVEEMIEGSIQAIEFRVTNQTGVIDMPLFSEEFQREFPKGNIIGGLIREENVIIPKGDTKLRVGDRVIVFCSLDNVASLEEFFALGESASQVSSSIKNAMRLF